MEDKLLTALVVILTVMLLPLVPKMVELRIRFLRWIGWDGLARFHEKGFSVIVLFVRCVLLAICLLVAFRSFIMA